MTDKRTKSMHHVRVVLYRLVIQQKFDAVLDTCAQQSYFSHPENKDWALKKSPHVLTTQVGLEPTIPSSEG